MTKVLLSLLLLALPVTYFLANPGRWSQVESAVSRNVHDLTFHKEVSVSGLRALTEDDIRAKLPLERSNFWWIANRSALEGALRASTLVQDANISSCGWTSWGCFKVEIKERRPGFIAVVGKQLWLVGYDGAFMTPVPATDVAAVLSGQGSRFAEIPLVRGLVSEGLAPDAVRARFNYLKEVLDSFDEDLGWKPRSLDIKQNGEMEVQFNESGLLATFDNTQGDPNRLKDEIRRLKRLIVEFKGREHIIRKVDLAFDKVAVVKLLEPSAADLKAAKEASLHQ